MPVVPHVTPVLGGPQWLKSFCPSVSVGHHQREAESCIYLKVTREAPPQQYKEQWAQGGRLALISGVSSRQYTTTSVPDSVVPQGRKARQPAMPDNLLRAESLQSNVIQMEDHAVQGGMLPCQREHLGKGHLLLMLPSSCNSLGSIYSLSFPCSVD